MDFMERALALARQALGTTSPNPAVGAVVVREGVIVGEGFTLPPGEGHAEAVALTRAGERARGATLYVTLEPCAHHGRVPPCTRAIIASGIARVHIATIDPNPIVNGKGKAELEAAGIEVVVGEREEEAREVIEAYAKHITTRLPFVTAKFAMSLDGKIATYTGDSRWITDREARLYAHQLRRASDAIMVGVNTVLRDDPRLTARDEVDRPLGHQPLRIVVDSHGRTPPSARLLREPGQTLIATSSIPAERAEALRGAGAEVLSLPGEGDAVDIGALLEELGRRDVVSILVEGGGTLLGSLFDRGLVDKVVALIAPIIIGGRALSPIEGRGVARLAEALRLRRTRVDRVGDDILVVGYTK
jgi:diaminohydroxyphosphoribosylaminopyrimidine deaminase/5-amino-6-(5-phosphoribosylamino)uracil reductase